MCKFGVHKSRCHQIAAAIKVVSKTTKNFSVDDVYQSLHAGDNNITKELVVSNLASMFRVLLKNTRYANESLKTSSLVKLCGMAQKIDKKFPTFAPARLGRAQIDSNELWSIFK